jgi:hypothetical protein
MSLWKAEYWHAFFHLLDDRFVQEPDSLAGSGQRTLPGASGTLLKCLEVYSFRLFSYSR